MCGCVSVSVFVVSIPLVTNDIVCRGSYFKGFVKLLTASWWLFFWDPAH